MVWCPEPSSFAAGPERVSSRSTGSSMGTRLGIPQAVEAGHDYDQMRACLDEIRERAATMPNGGAWAAGMAVLCLGTLRR